MIKQGRVGVDLQSVGEGGVLPEDRDATPAQVVRRSAQEEAQISLTPLTNHHCALRRLITQQRQSQVQIASQKNQF